MSAILKNKKILITREKSQAKLFSTEISQHGGIPIEIPLLKITCTRSVENERILDHLVNYEWIFFTSANGVHCFFEMIRAYHHDVPMSCKFAVVGYKTKLALEERGVHADFVPTRYNADTLAREFIAKYPLTKDILLVRGNMSRNILPKQLLKHGYTVDLMEVYETSFNYEMKQTLNQRLLKDDIDFITFTSPSTVASFVGMIDENVYFEKNCVCIGTTTEKRAREEGFNNIIVSDQFTIEGMIERIGRHILADRKG